MFSLSHFLLDERELYKRIKKYKSNLTSLREIFIETFFKHMDKRNPPLEELQQILMHAPFDKYPNLQKLYLQLVNLEFSEWEEGEKFYSRNDQLFLELNVEKKYFVFEEGKEYEILYDLFNRLMLACEKMSVLIEKTDPHEVPLSAYKLMALICVPGAPETFKYNYVIQQAFYLVKNNSPTPYHEALITQLYHLSPRHHLKDFKGWKILLSKYRYQALRYFADAENIERLNSNDAPKNINIAKAISYAHKYPRAKEDIDFAEICRKQVVPNEVFCRALDYMQAGWPRKNLDDLPDVEVADATGVYFWLKLPVSDKHALILGQYTPGSCQFIGGKASICVENGIELTTNGFYVLLKRKYVSSSDVPCLIEHKINDAHYEIVGQSYAWLSQEDDLCLDSIEWNPTKVSKYVIQELMEKFARVVYQVQPSIKHIHIGTGGLTPQGIFPHALRNQKMKAGEQYGDSIWQYVLSYQMPDNIREQLTELLEPYPKKVQNLVMFFVPFFPVEEMPLFKTYVDMFALQIQTQKINYLMSQRSFKLSDLSPLTFESYLNKPPEEQRQVTTIQKLMNAKNAEELLDWLPTIPAQDYELIIDSELPQRDAYLFQFAYCKNADVLVNVFQNIHVDLRLKYLQMTPLFSIESILHQLRKLNKFDLFIKLIALCPSNKRYLLVIENLSLSCLNSFFVSHHLDSIIEMLNMVSDSEKLHLLKQMFQLQCTSSNFPNLVDYLMTSLPVSHVTELFKTRLVRKHNKPVWLFLMETAKDFQPYLQLWTTERQIAFLEAIEFFKDCLEFRAYSSFRLMIQMFDHEQQHHFLVNKRYLSMMVLRTGMETKTFQGFEILHDQLLQIRQIIQLFVSLKRQYHLNVCTDFEMALSDYHYGRIEINDLFLSAQQLLQQSIQILQGQKNAQIGFFNSFQEVELVIQNLTFRKEHLRACLLDSCSLNPK